MRTRLLFLAFLAITCSSLQAQLVFPFEIDAPEGYTPTRVVMPGSPLSLQVLFIGGTDMVQTTATYGNEAGQTHAKEWHDFIGFTPDDSGESLGWVSVNHESIYRDDRIGDGGGMTVFRVERDEITGDLNVVDQTLEDGRQGKFFNVDFVNTVGETGMNCGGISSIVDGRIWTAEEWFRSSTSSINNGSYSNNNPNGAGPWGIGSPINQGVRDTAAWTVNAPEFPFMDGETIAKYENFNWMVEIDPRQARAVRKQYNFGRQGFEGGIVSLDNKYIYLGVDATPAPWVRFVADTPGDFTKGKIQVYKHDAAEKWITIEENKANMLNFAEQALAVGADMYDRNEWVAIDPETGVIYWTETGADRPGNAFTAGAAAGGVFAPHHQARAEAQDLTSPGDAAYWDYYGRVLKYDPATEEVSVQIEGGPYFAASPAQAEYPDKHLSNPDGLSVMTIDGREFLVICEDLNGETFGRMPLENNSGGAGIRHRMCEIFLLDLTIENPTVDDLIRLTATPLGAEITGAMPTPDGKSLLVNSQHPSGANPFPFNHSLTFAIHGFDELTVTGLQTLEELVYAAEPDHAAIAVLTQKLLLNYSQLHRQLGHFRLQHRHVFEAMREEAIRIFTLGVTGFDTPASGAALPEARTAMQALALDYQAYRQLVAQAAPSTDAALNAAFARGEAILQNDDFDGFDRLTFLREVINPLTANLPKAQAALNIESISDYKNLPSPINVTAQHLFDENYLNADYFANLSPGPSPEARRALGELLFFDPILSSNLKTSCASCHQPEKAFTDGRARSLANDGKHFVARNAPTVVNSVYAEKYFHDLREEHLERQMNHVVANEQEFATNFVSIENRLRQSEEYQQLFAIAYADQPRYQLSKWSISDAISHYVLSLRGNDSPFDRYARGEDAPLPENVRRGFNLFMGKAACGTCHFAPTFSGLVPPLYAESESEVLGVPADTIWTDATVDADRGRIVNQLPRDEAYFNAYAFKTPTVRNVAVTGPYMHNGVYTNLRQVMDFYNLGGGAGIGIDLPHQTLPPDPLDLTPEEINDVIAFMEQLTDFKKLVHRPERLPTFAGQPAWNKRTIGGNY